MTALCRPLRAALAAALALPSLAGAQQQVAVVRGTVHDSLLAGAPLARAMVWLEGTDHATETDSLGRFRLEGVRPGKYRAAFFHANLEALNIAAPATEVVVKSSPVTVELGTPSADAAYEALCGERHPERTGVVVGTVRRQGDRAPLAAARVRAEWNSVRMSKRDGLKTVEVETSATSAPDGSYILCHVPTDVPLMLRTEYDGRYRGTLPADLERRAFAVLDLDLDAREAPPGTKVAELTYSITRGNQAFVLPELESRVKDVLDPRGFEQRRLAGTGGYFYTAEDVQKRGINRIADMLATVPGVRLVYDSEWTGRNNTVVQMRRAQRGMDQRFAYCGPSWYINGVLMTYPVDDLIRPNDVDAMEVYTSMHSTPMAYQRPGFECGIILVWTKSTGAPREAPKAVAKEGGAAR
ncbi:MAG: carboxypeptidase regulatory-like domain-containing protein [Gemmatimonadales bacterium]|nr:carboxypeptidase regulatory-like domain-containing protein [Gemmatimonadales bacterium]